MRTTLRIGLMLYLGLILGLKEVISKSDLVSIPVIPGTQVSLNKESHKLFEKGDNNYPENEFISILNPVNSQNPSNSLQLITDDLFKGFWEKVGYLHAGARLDKKNAGSAFGEKLSTKKASLVQNSLYVLQGQNRSESPQRLNITLSNGGIKDIFDVVFSKNGKVGADPLDVYEPKGGHKKDLKLLSMLSTGEKISKSALPLELDEQLEIPLLIMAADVHKEMTFSWQVHEQQIEKWKLALIDRLENKIVDLKNYSSYSFSRSGISQLDIQSGNSSGMSLRNGRAANRFSLLISPIQQEVSTADTLDLNVPQANLKPNYPNPFASITMIPYELSSTAVVSLTVWNMIGKKVATLIEKELKRAGLHTNDLDIAWNAANMPSGMYIAKLEAGKEVFTRRITLIR